MKTTAHRDERTAGIENRIHSRAYHFTLALFVVSLIVKFLFFRQPAAYFDGLVWIDAAVFLVPGLYAYAANILHGHDSFRYAKRHVAISFGTGVVCAALIAAASSHPRWQVVAARAAGGFLIAAVALNILYFAMGRLSRSAAQKRADTLLSDDR